MNLFDLLTWFRRKPIEVQEHIEKVEAEIATQIYEPTEPVVFYRE